MSRVDRAERLIPAAPAVVWAALADPAQVARWLPPPGMTGTVPLWDLRTGGRWRIVLRYVGPTGDAKTDADSDVSEGRFLAVIPGARMEQEVAFVSDDPRFAGTMRMVWDLAPAGGGTRVRISAHDVPPGIAAADHADGMEGTLANLAAHLG